MQRARIIGPKNEKTATGAIFVRMCDTRHVFLGAQCTAIYACTLQCECSVAKRVRTALHVGFTFLVPMSNCMQCLIFFTCVSFFILKIH